MVFGMFGGKGIDISIGLDRANGTYAVGDTVGAQIVLANAKGGKVREVRAGLVRQHRFQKIDQTRDSNGNYSDTYVWETNETWITREVLANEGELKADDTITSSGRSHRTPLRPMRVGTSRSSGWPR